MKTRFHLLTILLLPAFILHAQQKHVLTVKEAVELAFKNLAEVKNAELDYKIQEAQNEEIFGQALPQRGVEARRHRGPHADGRGILVEEAREGVAHHFLFFGQVEIHRVLSSQASWPDSGFGPGAMPACRSALKRWG